MIMSIDLYTLGYLVTDNAWGDLPTQGKIIEIKEDHYVVEWLDGSSSYETDQSIMDLEDGE